MLCSDSGVIPAEDSPYQALLSIATVLSDMRSDQLFQHIPL